MAAECCFAARCYSWLKGTKCPLWYRSDPMSTSYIQSNATSASASSLASGFLPLSLSCSGCFYNFHLSPALVYFFSSTRTTTTANRAIWPSKGQLLYLLFVSYFAQTTWTNCTCWIYSYVWQPSFLFPGHLMSWLEAVRVFSETKWRHFGTPLFGDYSVIIINYLEVRVQVVFSLYTIHFSFFL